MFFRTLQQISAMALLILGLQTAHAEGISLSKQPITLIGPLAAGASTDVIARLYAAKLSVLLDTPVIVVNKPGASGMLAASAVARAPADGHTLLVVSNTYLIAPFVHKEVGYDAMTTFRPVTGLFTSGIVLASKPDFPAKNLSEFIALAKKSPGKYSYATWGVGTSSHLQMELIKLRTGIDVVHVPFKSGPEASQAVMGGHVDAAFDTEFSLGSLVRSGRIKPLVMFAKKRSLVLPDVQTSDEAGYPDLAYIAFCGIVAPAKTPKEFLEKLAQASSQVLADPEYISRLRSMGAEPLPLAVDQFGNFLRAETAKINEVTAKVHISAD